MNWHDVSDDEFIEEAQRRVNQGHWSPDRLMSQQNSDDRAKLNVLRSAIITMKCNVIEATGDCPVWLVDLASKCDELDAVYGTLPERTYAINTTYVGREAMEEHRPEAYQ